MIVCHCHRVGSAEISRLIAGGCDDIETIGERCGAGTECGGCLPWLAATLRESHGFGAASPELAEAS